MSHQDEKRQRAVKGPICGELGPLQLLQQVPQPQSPTLRGHLGQEQRGGWI